MRARLHCSVDHHSSSRVADVVAVVVAVVKDDIEAFDSRCRWRWLDDGAAEGEAEVAVADRERRRRPWH